MFKPEATGNRLPLFSLDFRDRIQRKKQTFQLDLGQSCPFFVGEAITSRWKAINKFNALRIYQAKVGLRG